MSTYNILKDISTDILETELKRRENEQKERNKPKQLGTFNLEPLRKICQEYVDQLDKDHYVDDDLEHYIFEIAIETVFGENIWHWVRDQYR